MKKFIVLSLLAVFSLSIYADNKVSVVDSSDNVLSIQVQRGKDPKRIPVQISMDNPSVPMTCIQVYIQVSDSNARFSKDETGETFLCSKTSRWTTQHQTMFSWDTPKTPKVLMALLVTPTSENLKGTTGPVITVYLDASTLSDGTHTIRMFDSNMVWTDKTNVTSYLTPDCETTFKISKGKLVK